MKVHCVFTFESPHRGDSKKYTQYTNFEYEKEKHPKQSQICSYRIFSKGLKNEFETAVVNKPSEFEPWKFYCIYPFIYLLLVFIYFWHQVLLTHYLLNVFTRIHFHLCLIFTLPCRHTKFNQQWINIDEMQQWWINVESIWIPVKCLVGHFFSSL